MSRFLKFIVHLIVILVIVCVLGLTLPPFFGVTTEIVDDPSKTTNLPMGSVTYAVPARTDEIYVGDPILVQEDGSVYRYEVESLDLATGTGTVVDPSVTNGDPITVSVQNNYVPKVVITLGYVGYLLVATKSTEGLIILGLCVLFLIILYVIAELWKKDDSGEGEYLGDAEAGNGYVKTEKELRKEEKERKKRMKAEDKELRKESKRSKKVRTGGFVEEIDEGDDEVEEDFEEEEPVTMRPEVSEAHELLKKEIAAATAEEIDEAEPVEEEAPEAGRDSTIDDVEVEAPKKRAIKSYTAAELSDQAKKNGDKPDVVQDDVTGIALFDYSDILGDVLEEDE